MKNGQHRLNSGNTREFSPSVAWVLASFLHFSGGARPPGPDIYLLSRKICSPHAILCAECVSDVFAKEALALNQNDIARSWFSNLATILLFSNYLVSMNYCGTMA